jgi:hypothetical protein
VICGERERERDILKNILQEHSSYTYLDSQGGVIITTERERERERV